VITILSVSSILTLNLQIDFHEILYGHYAIISHPQGRYFYFLWPTQPPIQWIPGALSSGVKRPGREADHPPPSSAEVKNCGAIPPLPHMSSRHNA
jgi:hypothetical protein